MKTKLSWFDRIMAAVTFAEANDHTAAKKLLNGVVNKTENKQSCKDCEVCFSPEMHGAEANS